MPWQLIFTSAPRGLTPGQSGYCTVARSREMREALVPRLEKLSYYHAAEEGEVFCAYRIVDLRGSRYHVLTRICDAGLDFTKRRKFLAHHLVFSPEELPADSPASVFKNWAGWKRRWEGEPVWLEGGPSFSQRENHAWGTTFTTRVQEGDHAADFQVVWDGMNEPVAEPTKKVELAETPPNLEKKVEKIAPVKAERRSPMLGLAVLGLVILGFIPLAFVAMSKTKKQKVETMAPAPPGKTVRVPELDAAKLLAGGVTHFPREFLAVDLGAETVSLAKDLERNVRALALPAGGSWALRPEKDFVGELPHEFGLLPSLEFDLSAIRSQVELVIAQKEKSVRQSESELQELSAREKDLVTSPRTPEEMRRSGRLAALKRAFPKAKEELETLRKKAALVPKDISKIGNFSLFLCQKDGCREIIRFDEEPELVRIVSP